MGDCIFCKIASKEMKGDVVRENDRLMVVRDIDPQAPVHLLVIPKRHYTNLLECEDRDLLGEMLATAAEAAREEGVANKGFRTVINTNDEGGQTVWHLHMHVLAGRPLTGKLG